MTLTMTTTRLRACMTVIPLPILILYGILSKVVVKKIVTE
jgi:hypothetical protein